MRVRDVMTSGVQTVHPTTPFKDAVEGLLEGGISSLPVISDGQLVGIVTEADLIAKEAYGDKRRRPLALVAGFLRGRDPAWLHRAPGLTVADVMTTSVAVAHPGDDVHTAARTMLERNVKRLPVVEDGRVVGIVTRADVLRFFARPDAEIAEEVERLLANPWRAPEHHQITASVTDGVVRLHGSTLHPSDIRVIEAFVRRITGVVDVDNRLVPLQPEPSVA